MKKLIDYILERGTQMNNKNAERVIEKNNSANNTFKLIKRFYPYLKEHLGTELLVLCCTAISAVCEIFLALIVRVIVNKGVENPANLTFKLIAAVGLTYIALRVIDSLAYFCQSYFGHGMGSKIEAKMRGDLFDHLQKLSFSFYDNTKVGQLMTRMTSDLFDVSEWAHHFPEMVLTAFVKLAASFFIFATMDWRFALVVYGLLPLMVILTKNARKRMKDTFKQGREEMGEINARTQDSLLGVRVVRSFTNEEKEREKFDKGVITYFKARRRNQKYAARLHSTVRFIDGVMYISVIVTGGALMRIGAVTAGDFTASLVLIGLVLTSIKTIVDFSEQFSMGITGFERFTEIMDIEPAIGDSSDAEDIENVEGKIEFKDVSFSYDSSEKKVLKNLNFTIEKGENVALVGPSGGGKTTICNLIPRFYEVESGNIFVDDKNIKDVTMSSLRKNIGIVAQDVYLFSGTVRENLLYGKMDATEEQMIEAARQAGAHDFIEGLPDGYDTYIGERGLKLSGGQKQRLSIARVFLKNPPILLLDEATSALDNENERIVQQSLERLAKGRTTLTIAHRLTTIKNADKIIVLTEDGIAEQGSHKELIDKNGLYAQLYKLYTID